MEIRGAVQPDYPAKFKKYVKCPQCGIAFYESLSVEGQPCLHDCGVISDELEARAVRIERERKERIN